jgi:hypothetical protein
LLQKIQKNSRALVIVALLTWITGLLLPLQAFAYTFTDPIIISGDEVCTIDSSTDNRREFGFTKRIVICVKETIITAVYDNLLEISEFFASTIAICCTFAILMWGVQMVGGTATAPGRDAMVLGLKIGGVILFTANFGESVFDPSGTQGGLFGLLLDAMEGMLGLVVTYVDISPSVECEYWPMDPGSPFFDSSLAIWDAVDCSIDSLMGGIFTPISISAGLIGFLVAAFFSSAAGFFIAILGVVLIVMLLLSIARAVYIFITGYMAFALMVLVSPIFITLLLFNGTKAYFEKWLKLTIGFMLQPVFIFAYLIMLLAAFDTIVYTGERSLYRAIAGNLIDDPAYFRGVGQWANDYGVYVGASTGDFGVQSDYDSRCSEDVNTPTCSGSTYLKKTEAGPRGPVGEIVNEGVGERQTEIYRSLKAIKIDVPIQTIDWDWMLIISKYDDPPAQMEALNAQIAYQSANHGAPPPANDPLNYVQGYYLPYIINIMISGLMAVVTGYIFMTMLKYLPFIGSGISGETLSMPTFGVGKFAPPGQGAMTGLQDKLAKSFEQRR